MSTRQAIWRVDGGFKRLAPASLDYEKTLEDAVIEDPEILGFDLLIIDRQIRTDLNRPLDLLGIDEDGRLHVVELKRGRTPRDVVAQALEYGSWVSEQTFEDVERLFERHQEGRLEAAFAEHFGRPLEGLHEEHQILIVASEMDPTTERITRYLADVVGAPIDIALFKCFQDDGRVYLARTWLAEGSAEEHAIAIRKNRPSRKSADDKWNGEDFIVNISHNRSWEDARRIGFLGAGGGPKWLKPLQKIHKGARVFAYVTRSSHEEGSGFVGVGKVIAEAQPIDEAMIELSGKRQSVLEALGPDAQKLFMRAHDPSKREHVILVDWIDAKPLSDGYFETGMVSIPASAYKLKHRFTRDLLYKHFNTDLTD